MKAQWELEKAEMNKEKEIKQEIENVKLSIEEAERSYDLEKLAVLQHGTLPKLKAELETELSRVKDINNTMLKEEVTEEEISEIVSKWTNIPVSKLNESEKDKLLNLPSILHQRVIGQDEAIDAVSDAVIRARAGLKDQTKPMGSFLFLGPTGVGKTELAKTLAENLFDSEENLIRIDMSEYMERHAVARLIGAPPGYVGYEEGGQLTEAVRRKPYSVILFDEVEKAHPEVFNILLQLLDDGRLTDSKGRVVNFKNTVIVLTSNIGSQLLLKGITDDGKIEQEIRDEIEVLLSNHFKPEFLNRLDDIVMFTPLTREQLGSIIEIALNDINNRLADRRINLIASNEAKEYIATESYNPIFGARPMKRYLQKYVETELGRALLKGDICDDDTIEIYVDNNKLNFKSV